MHPLDLTTRPAEALDSHSTGPEGYPNPLNRLAEVFAGFPYGLLVLDSEGLVAGANRAAQQMLGDALVLGGPTPSRCCDLVGCRSADGPLAGVCVTELLRARSERLPEMRVDLPGGSPAESSWLTAAPITEQEDRFLLHLRPAERGDRRRRTDPHWISGPRLRIGTLGQTTVESAETDLGGSWLEQRAGELLKFLIVNRHRPMPTEAIAEAIWPGGDPRVLGNVRHQVHSLRDRLEPDRSKRGESSFILSRHGGYVIDRDRVELDVEEFEEQTNVGLALVARGDAALGEPHLLHAEALYRGDFLSDEPFADWAFSERELFREQASEVLRALAEIDIERERLDAAQTRIERLADFHPFDSGVQRMLLTLCLRRGRKTEALRRYDALRWRLRRHFAEEPGFTLAELSQELERGNARRSA